MRTVKADRDKPALDRSGAEETLVKLLDWPNHFAWPFALVCFVLGGALAVPIAGGATGLGGFLLGALGGLVAFATTVIVLYLVLWVFVTPRRQREAFRGELKDHLTPGAFVDELTHDGQGSDILLPTGGGPGKAILTVLIKTQGVPMEGGMILVDVPDEVQVQPCSQEGDPLPWSPEDVQRDNGRRWFTSGVDLPGGNTAVRGFALLTIPRGGPLDVIAKVKYSGSPGWVATSASFQVVRPQP